jgi:hypothetical protein
MWINMLVWFVAAALTGMVVQRVAAFIHERMLLSYVRDASWGTLRSRAIMVHGIVGILYMGAISAIATMLCRHFGSCSVEDTETNVAFKLSQSILYGFQNTLSDQGNIVFTAIVSPKSLVGIYKTEGAEVAMRDPVAEVPVAEEVIREEEGFITEAPTDMTVGDIEPPVSPGVAIELSADEEKMVEEILEESSQVMQEEESEDPSDDEEADEA